MMSILALLACVHDPREGTAVGNPTGLTIETAPSTAVKLTAASAPLGALLVDTCDAVEEHPVERSVGLLGGDTLWFDAPSMCGLVLRFTGPLVYDVVTEGGGQALSLEMPLLSMRAHDSAIPVGGWLALELGGADWITAEDLRDGAASAERLAEALRAGASLFVDADGDGRLDAQERYAGPVASSTDAAGEDADAREESSDDAEEEDAEASDDLSEGADGDDDASQKRGNNGRGTNPTPGVPRGSRAR